jgi:hypothetical protein
MMELPPSSRVHELESSPSTIGLSSFFLNQLVFGCFTTNWIKFRSTVNMLWSLLITSSLFASSLAAPAASPVTHVVHEKRSIAADLLRRRVEPDALIPFRVGLQQSNLESGHDRLMDVSDPSSPNYGKHLSAEEVHSIFSPAEESIKAVKDVSKPRSENPNPGCSRKQLAVGICIENIGIPNGTNY